MKASLILGVNRLAIFDFPNSDLPHTLTLQLEDGREQQYAASLAAPETPPTELAQTDPEEALKLTATGNEETEAEGPPAAPKSLF